MKTYRKTVPTAVMGAMLASAPAFAQPSQVMPPAGQEASSPADDQSAAERIAELDQMVVRGSRFAGNGELGVVPVAVLVQQQIRAGGPRGEVA